jgi:hypothetical protein
MDVGDYGGVTGTRGTLMRKTNLWKAMRETLLTMDGRSPRVVRLDFASILPLPAGSVAHMESTRPDPLSLLLTMRFATGCGLPRVPSVCVKLNIPLRFT